MDRNHYLDTETGEIKEYEKKEFKEEKEIKKSMKELKKLILYHFQGNKNELFITLTCKDDVTEIKEIKKYAKYFIRKLKRKFEDKKFKYILKYERMGCGKWHIHMLLKDINNKELYIPNEEIEKMWKKGITKTQRVYDGNIINDENSKEDELQEVDVKGKVGIADYMSKTSQLWDIPIGEKIFTKSRNLTLPPKIEMKYGEAIENMTNDYEFDYEETNLIKSRRTDNILNVHKTERYKRIDKDKKYYKKPFKD